MACHVTNTGYDMIPTYVLVGDEQLQRLHNMMNSETCRLYTVELARDSSMEFCCQSDPTQS